MSCLLLEINVPRLLDSGWTLLEREMFTIEDLAIQTQSGISKNIN